MSKLLIVVLFPVFLSCKNNDNAVQFRALHESLLNQQKTLQAENTRVYREMENKRHDYSAQAKAMFWQPSVEEVKKLSATIKNYISELETDLKKETGDSTNNRDQPYYEGNNAQVKHLFEERGKSVELFKKLSDYKKAIIDVIKSNKFADNPPLQKDLARYAGELRLLILDYIDSSKNPNSINTDPISGYFSGTSFLAALTMLSKVKDDVLCAENTMLNFLNNQVSFIDEAYDSFSAIVTQSSNNLKAGEQLAVYAGIGAFSRVLKPTFTINGMIVPAGDDGKSTYELKINNKPGKYSIPVKIEFTKPDGVTASYINYVKYTVIK